MSIRRLLLGPGILEVQASLGLYGCGMCYEWRRYLTIERGVELHIKTSV
jgi:hypothetical protein